MNFLRNILKFLIFLVITYLVRDMLGYPETEGFTKIISYLLLIGNTIFTVGNTYNLHYNEDAVIY